MTANEIHRLISNSANFEDLFWCNEANKMADSRTLEVVKEDGEDSR